MVRIGLAIPRLSNRFFESIATGIARAEMAGNVRLVFAAAPPDDEGDGRDGIEDLRDLGVDGIVAVAPLIEREWMERIGSEVPLVSIGSRAQSAFYDTVNGDDRLGARLVMDHLLAGGHRSITHLTHEDFIIRQKTDTPHAHRLAAYESAMRGAGLAATARVLRCSSGEEAAYGATREVLAGSTRPTAIFAAHDDLALGVLRAAAEAGLDAGELAVVGYDNTRIAQHPLVALSSVDQAGEWMGRRAAEMILERLASRTEPLRETATPELKIRRSSAVPLGGVASPPTTP
ncbi:LacI family DNA-binding transcriptional regulator [Microbacterium sp. F51-2R]|uniref:LacI family DNA-binding transcriptional regulator n=1 Tax=Microbacterium sp. F51-2R TaxID=3445777 RepID=UPI003FA189D0